MQATCPTANLKLIKRIMQECPEGYEVDHTISLAEGGLHHQDNLQYLPNIENKRKGKTQNYNKSLVIRWQDMIYNL
jgi:5-methylcytosine-specific restriction endonuclease McrA